MADDCSTVADASPVARSRVTNGKRLLEGVDGRSAPARRYRDLIAAFTADLGGEANLTEADRQLIRQAAGLSVRAEKLQADIVNGCDVDSDLLVRISNAAARLLGAVRRDRGKNDAPSGPTSLSDYLAGKDAA